MYIAFYIYLIMVDFYYILNKLQDFKKINIKFLVLYTYLFSM